jgi:hypothetical protein
MRNPGYARIYKIEHLLCNIKNTNQMEISKFIRNRDHNPGNFHLYPEKIRDKYFSIVRNAIRSGTISGRRYKIIKGMIHEYSDNHGGIPIYNIHPSLFRTIKNNGLSSIYANIFPKRIAEKDKQECDYYHEHVEMLSLSYIKYRKYYIDILLRGNIENYNTDDSAEYNILDYHVWNGSRPAMILNTLIMDNILKNFKLEIILLRNKAATVGYSHFENKIFCYIKLEYYIQLLSRRRRRCMVIRFGDKFFNLLIKCFSSFVSKNCSRLAMYYV